MGSAIASFMWKYVHGWPFIRLSVRKEYQFITGSGIRPITIEAFDRRTVSLFTAHTVTKIEVGGGPSEYRLVLNGHESENKSKDGTMYMRDLKGGLISDLISVVRDEDSVNFSGVNNPHLLFDNPLKFGVECHVEITRFETDNR